MRILRIVALAGTLTTMAAPAMADHQWLAFGPRFSVAGINLLLAFGQPGLSYPRAYYYRTSSPILVHGAHCSSACFRDGGFFYHHEGCPLVRAHFNRYGFDAYDVFNRYAPRAYEEGRLYRYEDDYYRYYDGYGRGDDNYGYHNYGYDRRYDGYGRYGQGRRNDRRDHRYDRYDDRRHDRGHRRDGYDRYDDRRHGYDRGRGHSRERDDDRHRRDSRYEER